MTPYDEERAQAIHDAQVFKVLDDVTDALAALVVARDVPMDAGTCHLWQVRAESLLRQLGAAGMIRALLLVLDSEAKARAVDWLLALRAIEPHEFTDEAAS